MKPRDARAEKVFDLRRDNFTAGDCWILTDGHRVSLVEQPGGQSPKQQVTLDRVTFNRLIDWYMRDQKPRPADASN